MKFSLFLSLILLAALVVRLPLSTNEQSAMIFLFTLAASFLVRDYSNIPLRAARDRAKAGSKRQMTISQHPDFANFLDQLHDPVLLLHNQTIQTANKPAIKLLGEHIVGEDIRLAIRHPAAIDLLSRPLEGQDCRPIQLIGIGSRDQYWMIHARRLEGAERLVFLWDRSGIYAAERMRTDFVANASHELRTPLASIVGFIETLRDDDTGDDRNIRQRFLGVMEREAARMHRLIEDLISLSRIEAEKFRLPEKYVDMPLLIEEVSLVFRRTHGERGADIRLDIDHQLPKIKGDSAQLSQVLHNLVCNSIKYGRPGTPITISLHSGRAGNIARLKVSDEGEGIAAEHLPRLTERFYRVESSRSKVLGGTGLGLSIVKHIVERHRGRLEIDSKLGQGTMITISLPIDQPLNQNSEKK